ncbi:MAG: hypothetical protein H0T62_08455 [Parachlamydiaceae bacterium]|nr:hypothetical protein [Parachlamydiaceae bacterium]
MAPLSNLTTASSIGLAVAHAGSQAAHVLLVINPVTAGAMFVVRGVTSTVGLDNDLKLNEKVSSEFDTLDQQRQGMEKGSIVREIIEAKMHQLERQSDDVCASMTRNFATIISSKLGVAGSIGAIVGTKVVIGVAVGGALAASGIGAGVLLGAVGICATAYAIHKNKELISHTFEEVKIAVETPLQNLRHERLETEKAIAQSNLQEARVFHNKTSVRERKIKAYTNDIMSEINNLVSTKNKIAQQIHNLEPKEGASILDRMQASINIYSKENDIQKINEKLEQRKDHLRGIWEAEEKMISKFQRQGVYATKQVDLKAKESEEIVKRKNHLASESKRLAEEEKYINLALRMNDMTWQDVQMFHKDIEQRFENEPDSKDAVQSFLISQHYSLDKFGTDPASVVLEYVSKEMTV